MVVTGCLILGVVWSVCWSAGQLSGQSAVGFFGCEFFQWSVVGRLVAQSVVGSFGSEVVQRSVVGFSVFRVVWPVGLLVCQSVGPRVIWL